MTWRRNPGRLPADAIGKRVHVRLTNGREPSREAVTTVTPPGWSADGKQGCRWTITGHSFDIAAYEVIP